MADDVKLTFRFEDASQAAPQAAGAPTAPGTGQSRTTPGQSQATARSAAHAASGAQGSLAAAHSAKTATGGGAGNTPAASGTTPINFHAANRPQTSQPAAPPVSATQPMPPHQAAPNQGQQPAGPRQRWRGAPPPATRPQPYQVAPSPQPTRQPPPAMKRPASRQPQAGLTSVASSALESAKTAQMGAAQIVAGAKTGNPLLIGSGVGSLHRAAVGMGQRVAAARESASDLAEKAREAAKVATNAEARAERLRNAIPIMKASKNVTKPQVAMAVGRAASASNQAARAGAAASQAAITASTAARGAAMAGAAGQVGLVAAAAVAPIALAAGAYGAARYAAGSRRDQIEHVSGEILTAKAMAEVRQIVQDLKSNQKLGKGLGRMTDLESRISTDLQRAGDTIMKPIIEILNRILESTAIGVDKLADFMERHGDKVAVVVKFLAEMAGNAILGPTIMKILPLLEWALGKFKEKETSPFNMFDWFDNQPLPVDPTSEVGFAMVGGIGRADVRKNLIKLGLGVPS